MSESQQSTNILPDFVRGWFGEEAGQPGRADRVIFSFEDDQYEMRPLTAVSTGPVLWQEYTRQEIPPLWGLEFNTGKWNVGFVRHEQHVFLLVSIDKTGLQDSQQYKDEFLEPDLFQWVSQNQHTQKGSVGQLLKNHEQKGVQVHLFVRATRKNTRGKAAPFAYCGELEFVDWEGLGGIKADYDSVAYGRTIAFTFTCPFRPYGHSVISILEI